MINKNLFLVLLILVLFACKKEDTPAPASYTAMSDTPVIQLITVIPTMVNQFKDSIVFTIGYKDGDGDIGFKNADSLALYLIDSRMNITEKYHIPPLTPDSTKVNIQGTLRIVLDHTALLNDSSKAETTTYTIKLKDRANHWSNSIVSKTISINP